ncbi:hypothetical protein LJC60_01925 [Ruminococcaceae bacterium OttesenSCG-928-D13]|nr:hypothetical protein [Ruminococcaceae bacterium OttesenSCG-928-D13]
MDMLFNLSLYPVNALEYTHGTNQTRAARKKRLYEADELMPIPPIEHTKTATDQIDPRQPAHHRPRRPASPPPDFTGVLHSETYRAYPLSTMNVLARK